MRSTRSSQASLGRRFPHLLNCSPSHLLYFFACGEKIGATRFELATSRSRTVRSIQAELRPVNACIIDLNDLAGSVNCITFLRRRDWRLRFCGCLCRRRVLFQRCLDGLHEVVPFALEPVQIGAESSLKCVENAVAGGRAVTNPVQRSGCARGR